MFNRDGTDVRQCVACGFEEKKVFLSAAQELTTRVNQDEKSSPPTEVSVVKIFDNNKK